MAIPNQSKHHDVSLPDEPSFMLARPGDRAGAYSIAELEELLRPVLVPESEALSARAKWPFKYSLLLALGAGTGLWGCLLLGTWYALS